MPDEGKTRQVRFRATASEFAALQALMERHGLTISEMLRKLIRDAAMSKDARGDQ